MNAKYRTGATVPARVNKHPPDKVGRPEQVDPGGGGGHVHG